MASWTDVDGIAIERPVERKARGRSISLEQAIRLRDLLGALLVLELGLSAVDARAVLGLGAITTTHLRRRLKKLPPNVQMIFRELHREVASRGAQGGLE
jgi:hypothetical protein